MAIDSTGRPGDGDPLDYVHRHLRFGWWSLLFFLTLGMLLEAMHGLKVGWYLDVSNSTRRLMWTLSHAHGTLLALVNIAFAATLALLPGQAARSRRLVSPCLMGATLLLDLIGGSAEENAQSLRTSLAGEPGPHRDAITLGAGLALEVCGKVPSFEEGLEAARAAIDDGSASKLIEGLNAYSATRKLGNV